MTKYVSEERLKQIAHETHDSDDTNLPVLSLLDLLISECKELNPWMTLDEFLKSGFEGLCWVEIEDKVYCSKYYRDPDANRGFEDIDNEHGLSGNLYFIQELITRVKPIHKPEPPR